jgi:hypothetical protein
MRFIASIYRGLAPLALATTVALPALADHDDHGRRDHGRGHGREKEKTTRTVVVERPRRTVVVRTVPQRTRVVVHRGHPIRRPLPLCVVRSPRRPMVIGAVFLAPRIFTIGFVTRPQRNSVVWEDSEVLVREDDWTEFALNVEDRGSRLVLELVGKAQIDFADVVFANGEVQTVDFRGKTCSFGVYELAGFGRARSVDHVSFVARAKTPETRFIVRMQG